MRDKQHSFCTIAQRTEDITTCKGRAFPRCVIAKDKNEKKRNCHRRRILWISWYLLCDITIHDLGKLLRSISWLNTTTIFLRQNYKAKHWKYVQTLKLLFLQLTQLYPFICSPALFSPPLVYPSRNFTFFIDRTRSTSSRNEGEKKKKRLILKEIQPGKTTFWGNSAAHFTEMNIPKLVSNM